MGKLGAIQRDKLINSDGLNRGSGTNQHEQTSVANRQQSPNEIGVVDRNHIGELNLIIMSDTKFLIHMAQQSYLNGELSFEDFANIVINLSKDKNYA